MTRARPLPALNPKHHRAAFTLALKQLGVPAEAQLCVERVHFSDRRPPVILYRWHCPGRQISGYLAGELIGVQCETYARQQSASLRKRRRGQCRSTSVDPVTSVPGLGLALRGPGVDAKLPGLRLLHDSTLAARSVCHALGVDATGATARVRLRAQRLGKRAVLQIDCQHASGQQRVFARLSAGSSTSGAHRFNRHRRIQACMIPVDGTPLLALPAALGYDAELATAFYSTVPGETAKAASDETDLAAAGQLVLSQLRQIRAAVGPVYDPLRELAALEQWADRLGCYLPVFAQPYGLALIRIRREFAVYAAPTGGVCHRDLHDGQILISDQSVGLIDFDTLCMSDPGIDAGNLLAHLKFSFLRGVGRTGDHRNRLYALLQSDLSEREITRIRFWERVALLRVAAIHAFAADAQTAVAQAIKEVTHG